LRRVNIPLRAGNVELLLQYYLAREERIGDRGETGAAADTGGLFHSGCGFQRGLPCLDMRAARIEGEIRSSLDPKQWETAKNSGPLRCYFGTR
jgi:hypothetical protein